MEQEPPDELHGIKGHLLYGIVCPVLPGEYHFALFKGFDAVI